TGKSPFGGETLGETFANIVSVTPPRAESVRPDIPGGLGSAIAQCLERDRAGRPQSINELASRLLPFAPPEVARAAGRATRAPAPAPPTALAEKVSPGTASGGSVPRITIPPDAPRTGPTIETGPSWQTSGIAQEVPRRRPRPAVVVAGTAAVLLAAVAVGA